MQKYLLISLAGALGSLARYWVGSAVTSCLGVKFPYGTFVINITACIIIGFSLAILDRRSELNPAWRFLLPVGFVGASAFEWETFSTLQSGAFLIAALYVVLSVALGLVGVWCGVLVAKVFT